MGKNSKKSISNVTQKEVAKVLGMSVMTVSRALNNSPNVNEKTKERVLETAKKMGYTPNLVAKSLVSNRTFNIGVVIPEISHSFFPAVVRGIEEIAKKSNYQIFLTNTSENFEKEKEVIEALKANRVDGILISSSLSTKDYSYYKTLVDRGLPIVFFDRGIDEIGISYIGVNDRVASREITEHLISKGYKKIAYISGPREVSIGKERFDGFMEAMNKHNIEINEKRILENGYNEIGGRDAMEQLLKLPKSILPDAVVAVNDPVAFGAIDVVHEKGLQIPKDIAIVGFTDDIRAKLVNPPLTTMRQPAYEIGKNAVSKLIRTIEDDDEPVEKVELIAKLIIRKSCGVS